MRLLNRRLTASSSVEPADEHARVARVVGREISDVNLFGRAGARRRHDVPGLDALFGRHLRSGATAAIGAVIRAPGLQQRLADIEVVEHLHRGVAAADVFDFVGPREFVRADRWW